MPRPPRIRIIRQSCSGLRHILDQVPGRPSKYFYCDDIPGRRLRPEMLTSEQALEQAKALREKD